MEFKTGVLQITDNLKLPSNVTPQENTNELIFLFTNHHWCKLIFLLSLRAHAYDLVHL